MRQAGAWWAGKKYSGIGSHGFELLEGHHSRPSFSWGTRNYCSHNVASLKDSPWWAMWRLWKPYSYFIFQSWTCCSGCRKPSCPQLQVFVLDFIAIQRSPWFHPASPTAAAKYPSVRRRFREELSDIPGSLGLAFPLKNKKASQK